jgi:hypothetical protein
LQHSIIRRSAGVTIAFLTGHAFSFALFWGADRILDSGRFGLFYTAVQIIGIIMSPLMAVTLVLARQFAEIGVRAGRPPVIAATWHVLGLCARAAPFVLLMAALMSGVAPLLGIDAWEVAFLIPLTVLALVILEIQRASLQSMLLFTRANCLWISSTGAQCVLSLLALFLFTKVWTGIAGLLVAATLTAACFLPWFVPPANKSEAQRSQPILPPLRPEAPMIIGYSLFVLFNNVDILVGFVLLTRAQLDSYAASALLPKAIVTGTFAVAQVALPVVAAQRAGALPLRLSVIKAIAMAVGMAAAASILIWGAVPFVQATPLAISGLDIELMSVLAIGAVAMSTLRVLVVVELATQRFAIGLAQGGAIVLFALGCALSNPTPLKIAELYVLVAGGFLLISGLASLMLRPSSSIAIEITAKEIRKS